MSLLSLPSEIQTYIAALPVEKQRLYSGRRLRQITALASESAQVRAFEGLLKRLSGMGGLEAEGATEAELCTQNP